MNITNGLLCLLIAAVVAGWQDRDDGSLAHSAMLAITLFIIGTCLLAALVFFIGPARVAGGFLWLWTGLRSR